jgi:hypothetical protein
LFPSTLHKRTYLFMPKYKLAIFKL